MKFSDMSTTDKDQLLYLLPILIHINKTKWVSRVDIYFAYLNLTRSQSSCASSDDRS